MQLDTDEQLVGLVQTVLQRLANDAVNQERFLHQEFPDDIHQLFNRVVRRAYEKFKLDDDIDAFTFWGILESVMMHDYDKRIATHDAVSARGLLKAISFNLQLETTPKLVLVPLRKTTIENPIALAPMFLIPPQSDEVTFVKTLESLGLKAAPIREGLFQHMERTTGYNLTHRPLVLMETTRDEHKLQDEFQDRFVQRLLPLLRIFVRQFPINRETPNLEFLSAQVSERVYAGVIFDLKEGEMRRQGLDRMGGELRTGVHLSSERMKTFEKEGFLKILNWLHKGTGSLSDRVRNSLVFFNRACDAETERERLSAFLFAVIALESLFSRDAGTPLRATLADSVALLTESKMEARSTVAKRLRKIYDRRSEIVHSGKHEVSSDELRDAIEFCVRSLFVVLTLAADWGNAHDASLFEEIDRRKFS